MRIPRKFLLGDMGGTVHIYWQCHNRSFMLQKYRSKRLYLVALSRALKNSKIIGKVKIFSFCLMDNHIHLVLEYEDSHKVLSQFLRVAHTIFGVNYNKIEQHVGPVGAHRPRTPKIQNEVHAMRTHFYVEANPIRARKCGLKELKKFLFSSFRYFAYGEKDDLNEFIEVPKWYFNLGSTSLERQKKYLKFFIQYLREFGVNINSKYFQNYIGEQIWCMNQLNLLRHLVRHQNAQPPPIVV